MVENMMENLKFNHQFNEKLFFQFITNNINNEIVVSQYGFEDFSGKQGEKAPFKRSNYLLHFVIKGSGYVMINDRIFIAKSGDLFMLPPNTTIHYYPNPEDPWSYYWVDLTGYKVKVFYDRMQFSPLNPIYTCKNAQLINDIMVSIIDCRFHQQVEEILSLSHVFKLFSVIIEERESKVDLGFSKQEQYVYRTIDYIEKNYSTPRLNISIIAKELYLHPVYLSKIFSHITGTSLSQYIITIRLQKAILLFQSNPHYFIKEVAGLVGYSNSLYFSKEFKKKYHKTPTQFLQELKSESNKKTYDHFNQIEN